MKQAVTPQIFTRQEVLEFFVELGVRRPLDNDQPWHGYQLRDELYCTLDPEWVEDQWQGYLLSLEPELRVRDEGRWLPRYVPGHADCENQAQWFQGYLQRELAVRVLGYKRSVRTSGTGAFTVDYPSRTHGNHQGLYILTHAGGLDFFEVLTGQWEILSEKEVAGIWHVSGS